MADVVFPGTKNSVTYWAIKFTFVTNFGFDYVDFLQDRLGVRFRMSLSSLKFEPGLIFDTKIHLSKKKLDGHNILFNPD